MLIDGLEGSTVAFEVGYEVSVSSIANTNASSANHRCAMSELSDHQLVSCQSSKNRRLAHAKIVQMALRVE